ncbi:MAG: hypothetical protein U1D06_13400, partial [Paracoccaceae bacterium]|nr:hypothetical protein [Paracoccaceae bacterium]
VKWSYSPQNAKPAMTTEMLQLIKDKLPKMEVYATAILLESELDYVPPMNIGVDNYTFRQFIVTPPRFLASIGFIAPAGGGV